MVPLLQQWTMATPVNTLCSFPFSLQDTTGPSRRPCGVSETAPSLPPPGASPWSTRRPWPCGLRGNLPAASAQVQARGRSVPSEWGLGDGRAVSRDARTEHLGPDRSLRPCREDPGPGSSQRLFLGSLRSLGRRHAGVLSQEETLKVGGGVAPHSRPGAGFRDAERDRACFPWRELGGTGLLGRQGPGSQDEESEEGQTRGSRTSPLGRSQRSGRWRAPAHPRTWTWRGCRWETGEVMHGHPQPTPRKPGPSTGPRLCRMQGYFPVGRPRPTHLDSMR